MNISEFRDTLDQLKSTNSRNEKADIIRSVQDSTAAISFISGSEFDDMGLGKTTVLSVAQDTFDDSLDGQPTVSEDIRSFDTTDTPVRSLTHLHNTVKTIANASGNEQKKLLQQAFEQYNYPSVVSHACLNDLSTGCSDKTIANALYLRDSLPFYDSVVEAASAPNPVEQPVIHNALDPMLAKSESSLPESKMGLVAQPKLDGYRLLIHVTPGNVKAFTRRRNDVTESLPELEEIEWPEGTYLLDCEVIAADGTYKSTSERIGRDAENVERDVDMEFGLFDVIVFDAEQVHNQPYKKRYGLTTTVADLTTDERVGALPIFTNEEKAKEVASDYEGLIWKQLNALYQFGKRSKAWVKQKHMSETVDLVAAEFVEGEGRLDGTMGKIRLETSDGEPVGATGSGFTDAQRDEVWQNQDEYLGETLEVEAEAFGPDALRFPIFQRWRTDDGEPDDLERVKNVMPST